MSHDLYLPDDPAGRFREVYEALNAERPWWDDASALRFAAVSATTCPGPAEQVAASIREIAEQIKAAAGWFGPLRSHLRFIVAAILLQYDDDVAAFQDEVQHTRAIFREAGVRRDEIHETIAILILRIQNDRRPIERATVERVRALYEEMKRYHWWFTGPDDLPACALLAGRDETAQRIGERAEGIYQALAGSGFASGDSLQNAANVLAVGESPAEEVAARCAALAAGFRDGGVRIWQSDYDEIAILALLDRSTGEVVEPVLRHRETMTTLRPKPDRSMTFNLACNVTFLEFLRDENLQVIAQAKTLMDMQSIIRARQAAAAAG
jgi:hypothetical protein